MTDQNKPGAVDLDLASASWRKSTFSGSHSECVEVARIDHGTWRKSSLSGHTSECVEVAHVPGHVAVRDSRHPTRGALVVTASEWAAFLTGVRNDEFDIAP